MTPRWCGAAGDRPGAVGWSASAVPAPAGGAAAGSNARDVVPESRRVPTAVAAGRDVRDVVGVGDGAGEWGGLDGRGGRSGHADRDDDAQENVMLVT